MPILVFILLLQAAYKEWGNFVTWHHLFGKHPSMGVPTVSKDTAGIESECGWENLNSPLSSSLPSPPKVITSDSIPSTNTPQEGNSCKRPLVYLESEEEDEDAEKLPMGKGKKPKIGSTRTSKKLMCQDKIILQLTDMQRKQAEQDAKLQLDLMKFFADQEENRQAYEEAREEREREHQKKMEQNMQAFEEERARKQQEFEERRERERQEYEEKRERERHEYEEKREEERQQKEDFWHQANMKFQTELMKSLWQRD